MKRTLIVREPKAEVIYKTSHIVICTIYEIQYIGLNQIMAIYLNKEIKTPMKDIIALAKNIPTYFIDSYGTIIAKVSFEV